MEAEMLRHLKIDGIAALVGEGSLEDHVRNRMELRHARTGLSFLRLAWRRIGARSPRYEYIDELDPRLLDDVGLAGEPMESNNLWPSSRII
jgi:hypothetical protein